MRGFAIVALFVVGGCEKTSTQTVAPPVVEQPLPRAPRVEAPPPPLPSAPIPSDIDEDVVKKFLAYEKAVLASFAKRADDPAGLPGLVKDLEVEEDKQRQQSGVNKKQAEDLVRLAAQLKAVRTATAPELSDQIKLARSGLDSLPAEMRPRQEAEVKKAEIALVGIQRYDEQRKEFGAKAVDAALRHETELSALLDERATLVEKATPVTK